MRIIPILAVGAALSLVPIAGAQAQGPGTTGFDDLTTSVPPGYFGLNWSNFNTLDASLGNYAGSGYAAGVISAPRVAYNGGGAAAEFLASSAFTFNSVFLTAAWNEGLTVEVSGFLGIDQIFSRSLVLSKYDPTFATFDWQVDRVRFVSYGGVDDPNDSGSGTHFAMDDLTINGSTATITPEPVSMALLGTGLAGVGALRRRRRDGTPSA